jgi:small-conductance mechanosensitive channel
VTTVGVVAALGVAGVNVGALVASLGLIGLTIGLALRDILANYVAGVMLLVRGPCKVGEYVVVGDVEGTVVDVTARTTNLRSDDGRDIFVPNSVVFGTTVINVTRNPVRRFEVTLPVPADSALDATCDTILGAVAGVEGVLDDPAPEVSIVHVGETAARVTALAWVDARDHEIEHVRAATLATAHRRLLEAATR